MYVVSFDSSTFEQSQKNGGLDISNWESWIGNCLLTMVYLKYKHEAEY